MDQFLERLSLPQIAVSTLVTGPAVHVRFAGSNIWHHMHIAFLDTFEFAATLTVQ